MLRKLKLLKKIITSREIGWDVTFNYSIAKKTWFGTGGKTFCFYQPKDTNELSLFLKIIPINFSIILIGLGSNILFRDGKFEGVVIKLGKNFKNIEFNNEFLKVDCGVKDINLSNFCLENSISGFEFLIGIPGTIGGALRMNAGCFNQSISDNLIEVTIMNRSGELKKIKKEDLNYKYRYVEVPSDAIFIDALFSIKKRPKDLIKKKMKSIISNRKNTQPSAIRTGGSTFINPKTIKAWQLIDKIGYRGKIIRDVQVSTKHSNFLINLGKANSLDIETFGEEIISQVKKKTGFKLKWEIIRVGNFEKI